MTNPDYPRDEANWRGLTEDELEDVEQLAAQEMAAHPLRLIVSIGPKLYLTAEPVLNGQAVDVTASPEVGDEIALSLTLDKAEEVAYTLLSAVARAKQLRSESQR